jgi:plastocyanin
MRTRAATGLLVLAMVGSAIVSGAQQAAAGVVTPTYRVQVDAAPPVGQPWAFLRFFPGSGLQVHQGDNVDFAWAGTDTPHTATLLPSAHPQSWRNTNQGPGGAYQDPIPDTATGGDDPGLVENPSVVFPTDPTCGVAGNPCSFSGSSVLNSGFQVSNPAAEPGFNVQINAPVGTYSFICLLHPSMHVILRVVPPALSIPTPAAVAAQAAAQVRRVTKVDGAAADLQAQTIGKVHLAGGATRYLISAGGYDNGVTANEYPDNPIKVHVGDRIQFHGSGEIHTATVPAGAAAKIPFVITECEVPGPNTPAASPLDCANPSLFRVALNTKALAPTANIGLRPHRFINAGLLVGPSQHTFLAKVPGTYTFVCLVHGPEMESTIIVG